MDWFSRLSEDELPLVFATALYEMPLSQTKSLELLQLRQQTNAMGNPYDAKLIKDAYLELCKRQILRQEIGLGYQLRDEYRMTVLWHMHQSGVLKSWIASVRDLLKRLGEYQFWKSYDGLFYAREMQFSVLSGRTDDALMWREKFFSVTANHARLPGEKFFANDDGLQLFASLRAVDQGMLLTDLFQRANWDLSDCRLAYDYACEQADQVAASWPQLLALLAWQALLRGDFEQLQQLQLKMHPQYQAEFLIAQAVLQNKPAVAVGLAQTYVELQKAGTGKRKFFIPHLLGLFVTLALIAKNDTTSLKLAKIQIDEGVKQRDAYAYYVLQPLINHLAQGVVLPATAFAVRSSQDIDALFEALAAHWSELPAHPKLHAKLLEMRVLMQQRGYVWVAAEIDRLLVKQFQDAGGFTVWHAKHQIRPLLDLMQREEAWKRALNALSQLKPGAEKAVQKPEQDLRLAWLLDIAFQELRAEPREQKRGAKNSWSKGRPVALRRLAQEQDSLVYMSEQDKQIAACIRKMSDAYYGGSEFELNMDKALPCMVAHPAVYWMDAPDIRIDIVKGEIALQLKEKNDQIGLQLDPYIAPNEAMVWRKETPTRVAVFTSSPEIKQIAGILGRGLQVPVTARQQLIDVVAAIAPHLTIHSDLPELAAHMQTLEPDMCIYAHLLPLAEGLRVQLLVRPLPDGGWLSPGVGAVNLLGEQDGVPVQVSRRLAEERTHLQAIFSACPTLMATAQHDTLEWQLQDPEQCLELLSELRQQESAAGESASPTGQNSTRLQLVWPEGERFRIKGSSSLANLKLTIRRQGEWFVAGGEVVLDDGRVLALRELLQMTETGRGRFLKIGDKDYLALTESFKKRLEDMRALGELTAKGDLRFNPLSASAFADMADEVGELQADLAWRDQVAQLDALADFKPRLPSTLQAELRDYQLAGFEWLARLAKWGVGACLADDMGLGKTVQTLALLLDRAPQGPALVVAPISVAMNWQSEVLKFAPTLKVRAYHSERSLAGLGPYDIVIASYGMLQSDAKLFAEQHWHSVVLDEAQVIKNAATKRSQAAMALQADFKMIASGTPVENHLGELWNLFRFINPGLLGSKDKFTERFSGPIERGNKEAKQLLKKLIQPFILRRTKTQVLTELPPRTEISLQVELSDDERHVYEALRQEALDKIASAGGEEGASLKVLAEITKLRRFCCHPQLVLKNSDLSGSKLNVFLDTLDEILDNRHKVLVFSQFVDHLAIVRECLERQDIAYQYLDGSTPASERKKRVDAFQAGAGDVFLISLKAGGTGLNLTAADYVIHLDPWWNPAVEDQASDRAHRMGQQRPVTIYRLVTQNTIEEKIIALHAQKRDLADSLLEGGDATARLDTEALLRLLKESI
jgi:superfamily II DNA or RNA helicase/predicted transcriptional regulator